MKISDHIISFFKHQKVVMLLTLTDEGKIHGSAKGIVAIKKEGKFVVIDLFNGRTIRNIQKNPEVSITAIDYPNFKGYVVQGKARIIENAQKHKGYLKRWRGLVVKRVCERISLGVRSGTKSKADLEADFLAIPKHMIEISVRNIIDLSPNHHHDKL